MQRHTIALLVSLAILGVHPARAQQASERTTARALFDEGMRLYKEKNYQDACPKFEESLKLVDGLGTRGKLAECYEKVGRIASAWSMYREVAELAHKSGERRREKVASERAQRLEKDLSYLTINVSQGEHAATSLVRNGVEVGAAAFGTAVAVDPGSHEITATADGHESYTTTVEVPLKERVSLDIPALEPLPEPEPEPAMAATTGATASVATAAAAPTESGSSWRTPTGISLVAGGGVALATGLFFGVLAKSKWDQAFDDGHCDRDTNACTVRGVELTDSAKSRATLSTILVSSGLVLAGAGAAIWFWPRSDNERPAVSLSPSLASDELGVAVSGRF